MLVVLLTIPGPSDESDSQRTVSGLPVVVGVGVGTVAFRSVLLRNALVVQLDSHLVHYSDLCLELFVVLLQCDAAILLERVESFFQNHE